MKTYLCSFSHPNTWRQIFQTIFEKLGEDIKILKGNVGFEDECRTVIFYLANGQERRVRFHNIDVIPPCVSGGWFTFVKEKGITLLPPDNPFKEQVLQT